MWHASWLKIFKQGKNKIKTGKNIADDMKSFFFSPDEKYNSMTAKHRNDVPQAWIS